MRRALSFIAAAAVVVFAGGWIFSAINHTSFGTGLYWGVTTATTVGYGDVTGHGDGSRWLAIGVMLIAIPALAAAFQQITSEHVRGHLNIARTRMVREVRNETETLVKNAATELRAHVDTQSRRHADLLSAHVEAIKAHVTKAVSVPPPAPPAAPAVPVSTAKAKAATPPPPPPPPPHNN